MFFQHVSTTVMIEGRAHSFPPESKPGDRIAGLDLTLRLLRLGGMLPSAPPSSTRHFVWPRNVLPHAQPVPRHRRVRLRQRLVVPRCTPQAGGSAGSRDLEAPGTC